MLVLMSLSESPPRPAPGRSQAQLRDEITAIVLALRAGLCDDDAAALMPTTSVVALHGRGTPRRADARFVAAVHAVLDALPKHLLTQLPRALRHLTLEERLALLLTIQQGHPDVAA